MQLIIIIYYWQIWFNDLSTWAFCEVNIDNIDIITDITIFEDSGQLLVDLSGISTGADN